MRHAVLFALTLFLVASCGGEKSRNARTERARVDAIESAIDTSPERARRELLALIEDSKLRADDFIHLTTAMVEASHQHSALEVLRAAEEQQSFDPDLIEKLRSRVKYGSLLDELDMDEAEFEELLRDGCTEWDM